MEGCVDGTGEGGMTGSDSGLETVEGEDLELVEGDSSRRGEDGVRMSVGVRGILSH